MTTRAKKRGFVGDIAADVLNQKAPPTEKAAAPDPAPAKVPIKIEIKAKDKHGRSFDPEIHATGADGQPLLNQKTKTLKIKRGAPNPAQQKAKLKTKLPTDDPPAGSAPDPAGADAEVLIASADGLLLANAAMAGMGMFSSDYAQSQPGIQESKQELGVVCTRMIQEYNWDVSAMPSWIVYGMEIYQIFSKHWGDESGAKAKLFFGFCIVKFRQIFLPGYSQIEELKTDESTIHRHDGIGQNKPEQGNS